VRVSPHTAQAFLKDTLVGIPASLKTRFTLLPDRQNSQWHAERTSRSRPLPSHLRGFSMILSQRNTRRTWARFRRCRWPPVFALGHVSYPIYPVTGQPLLFPTSPCHPSMGLPYGWLARHCTWRSDGFSTFHVIISWTTWAEPGRRWFNDPVQTR
jgi:hypothetical protein